MIYIVEDDSSILEMESYALRNSGYEVKELVNGNEFWQACEKLYPTLVILDIMLPGEDGIEILRKMRQDYRTRRIPVILVTAKTTEIDVVKGLDQGADDYITKPFGIMEFISRVKVVLRRIQEDQVGILTHKQIVMDDNRHIVKVQGELCELTFKEYELLKSLLLNQGNVLTRDKIMDLVWDTYYEGESRTVDMHIKTLRKKLGEDGMSIKTIRNVGYKLE